MLTAEAETAVGNFGMTYVHLVYDERMGYKSYWDYFFYESEAIALVEETWWETLKIETISYSYFQKIKDYFIFYPRSFIIPNGIKPTKH